MRLCYENMRVFEVIFFRDISKEGFCRTAEPPPQKKKLELKNKFCGNDKISDALHGLHFGRNQLLRSADD